MPTLPAVANCWGLMRWWSLPFAKRSPSDSLPIVELAQLREQERQRADEERQRAEQERQRTDKALTQLEQERQRYQALEALLRERGINPEQL